MKNKISERDLCLKEKYPEILKNLGGNPSQTCMSWEHGGIAVGDGWIPILEQVFQFCQFHHDKNGYPQLIAEQIKEKFGSLRFYYIFEECTPETTKCENKYKRNKEFLEGAIAFAENLASCLCEHHFPENLI